MKLFKIIASQGGNVVFDDRLEAPTPREARNQMRALLGMRSLTGVVYSITEIPAELIGEIAEAKLAEALHRLETGGTPPSVAEAIRTAAAEEVRRQLGELRAGALASREGGPPADSGPPARFDPFVEGDPAGALDEAELARVREHARRQLAGDRERFEASRSRSGGAVERVRANVERRGRSRPRGRPSVTADGREIDWKSVKKLYLRSRSLKQTAAAFDISVNTVKARARKEGWARS